VAGDAEQASGEERRVHPSAERQVITTTTAKPGFFANIRKPYFKSWNKLPISISLARVKYFSRQYFRASVSA